LEHFHLYALLAAARQLAWAGCGSAAGCELDGADHLCALLAAVQRLALTGCGATPSTPPSHITLAPSTRTHLFTHSSSGLELGPILTGPHPRSWRASLNCTLHHIPSPNLSTHPSLTPPFIANGDPSLLSGSTFSPAGPPPIFLRP
jgi:hypothetical protein